MKLFILQKALSISPYRFPSILSTTKQTFPAEWFSIPHKAEHIFLLSQPTSFFHLSLFLTASACWFSASSWTFHTSWLWLAQLFILIYYPRIAITFFPLLSVSAPLPSAWPLNAVVSRIPNLSTILSLCFPSLPSLEALNHTSVSSLLHLFPSLSFSLWLQLCRQGLRAGISSDVLQEYALAHCLDCSSPTAPLSATKSSTQRGRTEKKCFTATFLYAIFSSQHL